MQVGCTARYIAYTEQLGKIYLETVVVAVLHGVPAAETVAEGQRGRAEVVFGAPGPVAAVVGRYVVFQRLYGVHNTSRKGVEIQCRETLVAYGEGLVIKVGMPLVVFPDCRGVALGVEKQAVVCGKVEHGVPSGVAAGGKCPYVCVVISYLQTHRTGEIRRRGRHSEHCLSAARRRESAAAHGETGHLAALPVGGIAVGLHHMHLRIPVYLAAHITAAFAPCPEKQCALAKSRRFLALAAVQNAVDILAAEVAVGGVEQVAAPQGVGAFEGVAGYEHMHQPASDVGYLRGAVVFHAEHHGVGTLLGIAHKAAQPRLGVYGLYGGAGDVLALPYFYYVVMRHFLIYGTLRVGYLVEAEGLHAGIFGGGVGGYSGRAAAVGHGHARGIVAASDTAYTAVVHYVGQSVAVHVAQIGAGGGGGGAPAYAAADARHIQNGPVADAHTAVPQIVAGTAYRRRGKEGSVLLTLPVQSAVNYQKAVGKAVAVHVAKGAATEAKAVVGAKAVRHAVYLRRGVGTHTCIHSGVAAETEARIAAYHRPRAQNARQRALYGLAQLACNAVQQSAQTVVGCGHGGRGRAQKAVGIYLTVVFYVVVAAAVAVVAPPLPYLPQLGHAVDVLAVAETVAPHHLVAVIDKDAPQLVALALQMAAAGLVAVVLGVFPVAVAEIHPCVESGYIRPRDIDSLYAVCIDAGRHTYIIVYLEADGQSCNALGLYHIHDAVVEYVYFAGVVGSCFFNHKTVSAEDVAH